MANWQFNKLVKSRQVRTLVGAGSCLLVILGILIVLLVDGRPKKTASLQKSVDITGIVDESFTEAEANNALTVQQTEMESLKKQIYQLVQNIKIMEEEHKKQLAVQKEELSQQVKSLILAQQESNKSNAQEETPNQEINAQFWHQPNTYAMNHAVNYKTTLSEATPPRIHQVTFRRKHRKIKNSLNTYLNPNHYVPSNTSVRAIILGGADADASVNGQSKNNGVMLFKLLENGTLPNGRRSHLSGCRVSANSYGDISSERAFATLYRLSCAQPGQPIIDKEVTGWVFFNGKVGIKGKPLMRDGKVMTWAGAGNLLSSASSVAQMGQSYSQATPFGPSSYVLPSNAIPYVGLGTTSKTGDFLAQYYVKRAEQYHPVIQIGAGNIVTVVFKDGFYLEPDENQNQHAQNNINPKNETHALIAENHESNSGEMNFMVPPEILGKIEHANRLAQNEQGALR